MSDDLVTIAVLPDAAQANLARNRLAEIGIAAFLQGEEASTSAAPFTGAFEGVKVQVAGKDAADARAFLERKPWQDASGEETAFAAPETIEALHRAALEDEEPPLSEREQDALRAFMAAVWGMILWPLQIWAFLLLGSVLFSSERLEGLPRRRAKWAACINLPFIALGIFFVVTLFTGPFFSRTDIDLRDLPHPEVLAGSWEGEVADEHGKTIIRLELRKDGKLRWTESGGEETIAGGLWAYTDHRLYFRLDRFEKMNPIWQGWQGKVGAYEMERFTDLEMVLRGGDGKFALRRK
ncbi:MAG: hypothetical protein L0215_21510 [Gemmataceae bacterium]|nr:hypothetical protein [Gemmataceae bacterium]